MAFPPPTCPYCGTPIVPGANYCQGCGAALSAVVPSGAAPPSGPTPLASGASGSPTPFYGPPPPYAPAPFPGAAIPWEVARDRERTGTGLLLLVIGIGMSWVPFLSFVGDLLALIGIILVFLARRGYGPEHHRYVVVGGALFVVTILAGVGLVVGLVAAIFGQAAAAGQNVTAVTSQLQNDFLYFFVGLAVVGVLGSLSRVLLVYGLSDRETRLLLWVAFAISVLISTIIFAVLYPQIVTTVNQATSGSSVNTGPLTNLENESTVLGLANVVPVLLFAWAYWRAREASIRRRNDPAY